LLDKREVKNERPNAKEQQMLARAGTGYRVIGILVIILLIVLILYFIRRV
jgi:hypothetical protein